MKLVRTFLMIWTSISFALVASPLHAASQQKLPVLDRMVASVNDEAITESELNQQTQLLLVSLRQADANLPPLPELRKQLLDKIILEKLQLQLAKEQGIEEPSESMVDQTIEDIASRDQLTVHQLQQFLEEQGISYEQFRRNKKNEIIISQVQMREIGQNVSISDKELQYFLQSPAGQDQSDTEYHLSHILIPLPEDPTKTEIDKTKEKSMALVKELKNGADFTKMAIAKSAGQQALNGGDLGWRTMASIPSSFVKYVAALHVGEIYGPIQDSSGFHIIKLLDKRAPDQHTPGNANAKATELLYQRKYEEMLIPWLRNLRANAEVEIFLNES